MGGVPAPLAPLESVSLRPTMGSPAGGSPRPGRHTPSELASSKKVQKDLQQAMNEVQLRFQKSEEQRDMLAGSLAKQEEYHESANKAREEMHQIQLEDAADELRSIRRKSTALATALQQNVRMNELDGEVALLVEEFAETMEMTPQTALPTPTMTLNEPKTKPKKETMTDEDAADYVRRTNAWWFNWARRRARAERRAAYSD